MICSNCGNEISSGAVFCEVCGAKIEEGANNQNVGDSSFNEYKPTPNITYCEDGVYRWSYDFNMLTNPMIFLTVFKVIGAVFLCIFGLVFVAMLVNNGLKDGLHEAKPLLYVIVGFIAIILISYFILAMIYGFKYKVFFEMDEEGITHTQLPSQTKKVQGIAVAAGVARAVQGNPIGGAGQALLVASNNKTVSTFETTRRVKVYRMFNTIKMDEPLAHNQVYCRPEDFDFVLNYILERVPDKAKK